MSSAQREFRCGNSSQSEKTAQNNEKLIKYKSQKRKIFNSEDNVNKENSFKQFINSIVSPNSESINLPSQIFNKKEERSLFLERPTLFQKNTELKSPSLSQKSSFETMMEEMLRPDLVVPIKKRKENVDETAVGFQSKLPLIKDKEKLFKKKLTSDCPIQKEKDDDIPFKELIEIMLTPDCPIQKECSIQEKKDNDISFEELMDKMLTPPECPIQKEIETPHNTSSLELHTHNEISVATTNQEKEKMLTPNSPIQNKIETPHKMSSLELHTSHNKNSLATTSLQKENKNTLLKTCSTQTSFDLTADLSQLSYFSSQTLEDSQTLSQRFQGRKKSTRKCVKDQRQKAVLQRSSFLSLSLTQQASSISSQTLEESQTLSKRSQGRKKATRKCGRSQRQDAGLHIPSQSLEETQKIVNILDVLSNDITERPDGLKIFNGIGKVGTEKWLQSALSAAKTISGKTKRDELEIREDQNVYNLYFDVTKIDLQHETIRDVKICRFLKKGSDPKIDSSYIDKDSKKVSVLTEPEKLLRESIDEICNNPELISSCNTIQVVDKKKLRFKIHDILAKIYGTFENGKVPSLVAVSKNGIPSKYTFENGRLQHTVVKKIRFLVETKRSRFCLILYMLGKVYNLLENNTKLTKREIYYQVKHLVPFQRQINTIVEEVSRLIGVGPWDLNIISHSGLVYGNLKIFWTSGEMTNCNAPATLIPYDLDDIAEIHCKASFILVVEKESIFHKLLEEDLPNKLARPFILITGKGMPDINTRFFIKKISTMLSLPVFILVDPDLYGIRIMLNYRFGSLGNTHLVDQLAVPNARWLGVFPSEISKYNLQRLDIPEKEKKLINSLLKYPYLQENPKIAEEIQYFLKNGKKASIEGLIKTNTFLSESYLPMKFFNQDFI